MLRRAGAVDGGAVADDRDDVPRRGRGRRAAAGTAGAAGSGLLLLARLIRLVTAVLALIIALAIAFVALGANESNSVVSTIHDWARSLVGPFDGIFNLKDHKLEIAVNWGLALLVYLIVGSLIASVIARAGLAGRSRAEAF